ncbi:uncharacterized protein LOC115760211 isoform X2 [Drosophila novamexicana]|uniref:uncharacterized protein LOC115760211 isoform X2 n=1 Tax=Drosophila novamexicana TaxID=47314 RepID=UPI0011E5CDCD|nr:uncharacterized protein LOC115760211 isoform X2 [Drosophila novamexicana]
MQSNKMGNRSERKQELPCKSMPNLYIEPDGEGESSLNPYALEFIPSYLKGGKNDNNKKNLSCQKKQLKTEATSTTTLAQREFVGDASYLQAQRQLFELLHQLGDKFMPLKAIKLSLAPDGQGINVQFKGEHGVTGKQMLDESLCQNSALHLEISDRSFMPRRLPNVLAANFMVRMGDVLNDKMEWNEESICSSRPALAQQSASKQLMETKPLIENKPMPEIKRKSCSVSASKDMHHVHQIIATTAARETLPKKQQPEPIQLNGVRTTLARPSIVSKVHHCVNTGNWNSLPTGRSKTETRQKTVNIKQEPKYDNQKSIVLFSCTLRKKSNKGIHTPRQSLGQIIKKGLTNGAQKFAPRSTYTSQMRQSQVQKRMSLLKATNN